MNCFNGDRLSEKSWNLMFSPLRVRVLKPRHPSSIMKVYALHYFPAFFLEFPHIFLHFFYCKNVGHKVKISSYPLATS